MLIGTQAPPPSLSTLGLNWRSANLTAAAEHIRINLYRHVPDSWLGDYMASAVQYFALGRPRGLMDTINNRMARRVLGGESNLSLWNLRLHLRELAGEEGRMPNGIRHSSISGHLRAEPDPPHRGMPCPYSLCNRT